MLVRWTTSAADDLTHICDYTEEHFGPPQARRTALAIYDGVEIQPPETDESVLKVGLRPLLQVAALFRAVGIRQDKRSRDWQERSAPRFSHRLCRLW
jgi:hypothetical protein